METIRKKYAVKCMCCNTVHELEFKLLKNGKSKLNFLGIVPSEIVPSNVKWIGMDDFVKYKKFL